MSIFVELLPSAFYIIFKFDKSVPQATCSIYTYIYTFFSRLYPDGLAYWLRNTSP